jgi:hypothetical protein
MLTLRKIPEKIKERGKMGVSGQIMGMSFYFI